MIVGKECQILTLGKIYPSAMEFSKLILQVDDDGILAYRRISRDGNRSTDNLIIGYQTADQWVSETMKTTDEDIIIRGQIQMNELLRLSEKIAEEKRRKVGRIYWPFYK